MVVGLAGVLLLVFFSSGVSVVSCCRVLVVVSSLWFVGGFEGGWAFLRAGQIMCLSRGRSKGEDCGHVKSI